jgi:GAF domain-containing protein
MGSVTADVKPNPRSKLAELVAATSRLHGTRQRDEALSAVREMVVNVVGAERLAVFEMDAAGARLILAGSLGVDPRPFHAIRVGSGPIGRVAQTGAAYVAGRSTSGDDADGLTACVPLKVHGRVIGAIAIFALVAPSPAPGAPDEDLLELLAAHAATMLYCSGLQLRLAATVGRA